MDRPADEMLLAAPPSDEPYVYGAGETAAPVAAAEIAPLAEPVRDEAYVAEDFVPPRHRPVETAHAAVPAATTKGEGFAFDINAFVDELEREAESAGREWSGEDGEGHVRRRPHPARRHGRRCRRSTPPAEASVPAVAAVPAVEAALARALTVDETKRVFHTFNPTPSAATPSLATLSLESWEPEAREPAAPTIAPPPVRHVRTDSFTWKRFALLGLFVVGAIGAGVALQSVAARNDSGAGEPAGSAAVASVAPSGDTADLRGDERRRDTRAAGCRRAQCDPKGGGSGCAGRFRACGDRLRRAVGRACRDRSARRSTDGPGALGGWTRCLVRRHSGGARARCRTRRRLRRPKPRHRRPRRPRSRPTRFRRATPSRPTHRRPGSRWLCCPRSPSAAAKPTLVAAAPAARPPVSAVSNAPPKGTATIKSGVTLRGGPDNKRGFARHAQDRPEGRSGELQGVVRDRRRRQARLRLQEVRRGRRSGAMSIAAGASARRRSPLSVTSRSNS